jgi:hypothetical protein
MVATSRRHLTSCSCRPRSQLPPTASTHLTHNQRHTYSLVMTSSPDPNCITRPISKPLNVPASRPQPRGPEASTKPRASVRLPCREKASTT